MSANPSAIAGFPPTPLPNSYWVVPGRMLAGEYPALVSREESLERLRLLLAAGVQYFVDLTQEEELPPYAELLQELGADAGIAAVHARFPIVDHGVPENEAVMRGILDAIDAAMAAGRCVYIHCRAGIGRTGTVAGCHLIRHGRASAEALAHLGDLWQQNARSSRWPTVPETPEQRRYVEQWREPQQNTRASAVQAQDPAKDSARQVSGGAVGKLRDRAIGALVGLAAAEVACSAASASSLLPNTAMTVCLGDSLLACGKSDAKDQMQRYLRWVRAAQQNANRQSVPIELQRAVAAFQFSRKIFAGSHDPANRDAHSLARTTAVALFYHDAVDEALRTATEASRTTQQSPIVLDACRVFAALLIDALAGHGKKELLAFRGGMAMRALRSQQLKPELAALLDGQWRGAGKGDFRADAGPPDVLRILSAALRALDSTGRFQDAVQFAVGLGERSGTLGAVCGALAGAYYGVAGIPAYFRQNYHRYTRGRTGQQIGDADLAGDSDLEGDPDLEDLARNLAIENLP